MDFCEDSVEEIARAVRFGDISARDVVSHALNQITLMNGVVGAFVAVDEGLALKEADSIDARIARGEDPGALAGVPIGVKDLEDAAGLPTSYGSAAFATGKPASRDSVLVGRLKAAGAIVVGKTNTPELGWKGDTSNPRLKFATRNPWRRDLSAGGSSGGSAAAVATGMVPMATGSDGGGSIRIPSSFCGITGFKPSPGRIPITDVSELGWGHLSSKGVLARTIADIGLGMSVVVGPDARDMYSLPKATEDWGSIGLLRSALKIAWSPDLGYVDVDPEIAAICFSAVNLFANSGHDVSDIGDFLNFDNNPAESFWTLTGCYNLRTLAPLEGTPVWGKIDPELRESVDHARGITAGDLIEALDNCGRLNLAFAELFDRFDILITPTCAGPPPPVGASALRNGLLDLTNFHFLYPMNLTRIPAATVNIGWTRNGLPVGLQVVGRQLSDLAVMQAAASLEALYPSTERPEVL